MPIIDIEYIIAIFIALLIIALAAIFIKFKKKPTAVDYKQRFNIGIIWTGFGIVMAFGMESSIGMIFFILGLVFLADGWNNKKKWGKKTKMTKKQMKMQKQLIIILSLLAVLGLLAFVLVSGVVL
ncbi:MAG: hypothetical protein GOV02_00550 [Candidatus Aenigmarchaeota archaeon]|nr:hypothetical protein [Candidatus Aenigmarchaeota archaeon]